ncbi:MAG: T9SS type A sorting domain-containing protein [Bacteroidota bacterium]|nr:T9SS type A sorting domain-containing protein [Bacteroidota bacterium]
MKDSDGDSILDCWESEGDGIDVNADGIIDYNLWAKGARPNHKDMFVEVDWMEGFRPNDTSIAMVVDAFKEVSNGYVNNPDGKPGINLVVEVSTDTLATSIWDLDPWPEFFDNKLLYFGTIGEREAANQKNILDAKRLVYRYCIFAHSFNPEGWSGIAEYNNGAGGNDLIVSLGKFGIVGGDKFQQAGTFMHEMGHTIGLDHGGIDDINYKPNYYSVMNYTWQFPKKDSSLSGLTWKLDYSPAALPTLVENSLNEAAGLSPQLVDFPSPIFIPFSDTSGAVRTGVLYPNAAIDWDGDGDSSGLATIPVDINNLSNPRSPSPGETLEGFADWQNLKYNFRNSPTFLDPSPAELLKRVNAMKDFPQEMTPAIYNYLQSLPPYGIVPPVIIPSSLIWLGTLGGYKSEAWGISDDGLVVTGYAMDPFGNPYAFRWTAANGMINLGTLGGTSSTAAGISSDGNTIVGIADDSTNIYRAFKWTEAAGMQDLGAGDYSRATSVSSNGTAITVNVYPNAYRWTLSGGLQNLGSLGGNSTAANAVSSNGSVIVGSSYNASNDPYAFRWVENGGMTNIGIYYSFARGVSGDGNTVTGFETGSAGFYRAFRWTAPNGFEMNIVGNFSSGWDVSYDGKYLVGDGSGGAFRLSQSNGLEFFNQTYSGLLTSGSEFYTAAAISSNGRFVVGYGHNSSTNRDEAYLLDTGGIPMSIEDNEMKINTFALEQNYPNPFNPSTAIQFGLPYTSHVTLKIFNILGQEVATLLNEKRDAGQHSVQWVARGLASGVYFYRLYAHPTDTKLTNDFVQTKKLMLMK